MFSARHAGSCAPRFGRLKRTLVAVCWARYCNNLGTTPSRCDFPLWIWALNINRSQNKISLTMRWSTFVFRISMTGQLSEWCRNWPTESWTQHFPGCVIRRLSACTCAPHREGNSMGGLPLFTVGIRNWRGCRERRRFCPNWKSNSGLQVQSPVHCTRCAIH